MVSYRESLKRLEALEKQVRYEAISLKSCVDMVLRGAVGPEYEDFWETAREKFTGREIIDALPEPFRSEVNELIREAARERHERKKEAFDAWRHELRHPKYEPGHGFDYYAEFEHIYDLEFCPACESRKIAGYATDANHFEDKNLMLMTCMDCRTKFVAHIKEWSLDYYQERQRDFMES